MTAWFIANMLSLNVDRFPLHEKTVTSANFKLLLGSCEMKKKSYRYLRVIIGDLNILNICISTCWNMWEYCINCEAIC